MEVQELRVWAHFNKEKQKEVGLAWDEDQQHLCEKLNRSIGKNKEGNSLVSKCQNCGRTIQIGSDGRWWHYGEAYNFDKDDKCQKAIDAFDLKKSGFSPTSSSGFHPDQKEHKSRTSPSHKGVRRRQAFGKGDAWK